MVYSAEFIEGTAVQTLWLELKLCSTFAEPVKIVNVSNLGSDAVGYMSVIRRLHLSGSSKVPATVILKTPSPKGGMEAVEKAGGKTETGNERANLVQEVFHDEECETLTALNDGEHNVKVPKLYYAGKSDTQTPCIIMEEIVDCTVQPLIPGFDEAQLYILIDQIVELQHWSLKNTAWRKPMSAAQEELGKSCTPMLLGMCSTFFTKHKAVFGELGEKMMDNTLRSREHYTHCFRTVYETDERPVVLVHGDMWTANFLWHGDALGAIVDWQLAHAGNVVEDIMRLLTTCTSSAIRRRMTTSLLNHYYNLWSSKSDGKLFFSREQLEEEYKFYLPACCVWTTFAVAFWENSILDTEGKVKEAFDRLKCFLEDTAELLNW